MTTQQPEALRLADVLSHHKFEVPGKFALDLEESAAELREGKQRMNEETEDLKRALNISGNAFRKLLTEFEELLAEHKWMESLANRYDEDAAYWFKIAQDEIETADFLRQENSRLKNILDKHGYRMAYPENLDKSCVIECNKCGKIVNL